MKGLVEYFRSYNNEVMVPYKAWISKHKIGYYVVGPMTFIGVTYVLYKLLTHNKSNNKNQNK